MIVVEVIRICIERITMNLIDVKSPADLKGLSISELTDLTAQARQALMTKVSEHGGHFGPPMGAAEMIMALHYVFNSPVDKIVYDVSHQSYVHKMVTGRALAFLDHDHYDDVTGYTDPTESEHDFFNIGHTSTSISLASGLATARNLKETLKILLPSLVMVLYLVGKPLKVLIMPQH